MAEQSPDSAVFTAEDRIRQLADIDRNVAKLLRSAGEAIQALTSEKTTEASAEPRNDGGDDDDERKSTFTAVTAQYFTLLSSVDVNIRRQIYALEEANIIPADASAKDGPSAKEKPASEGDGFGSLDVGWLNSRNDKVGKEIEAELWEKASSLLREVPGDSFIVTILGKADIRFEKPEVVSAAGEGRKAPLF